MTTKCAFAPCPMPRKTLEWCPTHYLQQYNGRTMRMVTKRKYPVTTRDETGNKRCSTCEQWRPEADFASSYGKADGLQSRCRECNAAIYRARADLVRDKMREQRFGLTRGQFDAMFEAQGNACAICATTDPGPRFWCVDHDHACCPEAGRSCGSCIRGILCGPCNHALGNMRDRPELLRAAAHYLERNPHRLPSPDASTVSEEPGSESMGKPR